MLNLTENLAPSLDPWWNRTVSGIDDRGGNTGLFKEHMENITASGPAPYLKRMALMAVPIIIKGIAERFDPCYGIMKQLHDQGLLLAGLNWASVLQMMPVNIFFGFGWGPPLLQWGMLALSLGLLPGESRKSEESAIKNIDPDKIKCEKG
jgi:hypothetical protein